MSRNWPLVGAVVIALGAVGGVVAHRMHKVQHRTTSDPAEEQTGSDDREADEPEVAPAEPGDRTSSQPSDTTPSAPPQETDRAAQPRRPAVAAKGPLKLPARFVPPRRSARYALYAAAGKRAERFPSAPSVSSRWFEGADGHARGAREMRSAKADMVVYFYTDW